MTSKKKLRLVFKHELSGCKFMNIILTNPKQLDMIDRIGRKTSSAHQRLILGVTALVTQPVIDYYNKKADDDTRAVSVARTIGKIVAGTAVGVGVRAGSIELISKFSNAKLVEINGVKKIVKKSAKDIFVPLYSHLGSSVNQETFQTYYSNYTKALGTFLATFAMIFTNFLLDVPLTRFITNALSSKVKATIVKKENGGKK